MQHGDGRGLLAPFVKGGTVALERRQPVVRRIARQSRATASAFRRTHCLSPDMLSSVSHGVKRIVGLPPVATRKYEQRLRAEDAEQTRRRILDALQERLRQAPAEPVSVDQIARAARVSRSTVYLAFGSRAGLFCALGADIADRGGL